jgi:serine/threonine-protein kinase
MSDDTARLSEVFAGTYDIDREVGRGGMATVYLATDVKHDRPVALKILRPELTLALGGDRFPREIQIVAQLSHPHILPLHDSGERGGFLYYVMPYVEGESLRGRLRSEGKLSVEESIRILREVADALAYAHGRGIVHRDIKPENVMLSGRHAHVMDFGVAKAVSVASGEQLTTVGVALGTPTYMSPEQAMGQPDVDARSDIYALGILGYEMLTGSPPFVRDTPQALLSAQVIEPPRPVTEIREHIPGALGDLVMRCLAKDPADRWADAEEVHRRLEQMATPSGGITPTYTRPVDAIRTAPRKRLPLVAGLIALIVLLAAGAFAMFASGGPDGIESIAVLPIQDISGNDQAFVDAVHDALVTSLARANVVSVVSRSNVMRFQGGGETTREIADALDVQAVVEGTVFRAGDRMRITVQMVDPQSLRQLWSQVYERDVDDVLAVQGEVAGTIATELAGVLTAAPGGASTQ